MTEPQDDLYNIPPFSLLSPTEFKDVRRLTQETTYQKDNVICREGDPGDAFYLVLEGELEVAVGEGEKRRVTGLLQPGDFFGEMALLQGGTRTATVIATRRTKLVSLNREAFLATFLKNAAALEYLTRVLCKRLAMANRGDSVAPARLTIAVSGAPGVCGKTVVATALSCTLHQLTGSSVLNVCVVTRASAETDSSALPEWLESRLRWATNKVATIEVAVPPDKPAAFYGELMAHVQAMFSERFRFIVFDLASRPPALAASAGQFCDAFVQLVARPAEARTQQSGRMRAFQVVNLYNSASPAVPLNSCEPFVIPRDLSLRRTGVPKGAAAIPLQRLTRKILGCTMGVALGGGAAFGIAHLGVLQVLERDGVPIDLVAGCSQGSIIGIGYAAGVPVEEMIKMALRLGRKENFGLPLDFTMSKPGILAGDRFTEIFSALLGHNRTFESLIRPCRAVATNIETGAVVEIGGGSLSAAFRASASLPMLFSPCKLHGHVLVDGGVSDPVPAKTIENMGGDLCIAVNVVPPLKKGIENAISRAYKSINRFNPLSYLSDSRDLPSTFDVVMNSLQILQYELGNFKAISADVLINPDLSEFTWVEYYRSRELIDRGIAAAEYAIPQIRRVLADKLAGFNEQRPPSAHAMIA